MFVVAPPIGLPLRFHWKEKLVGLFDHVPFVQVTWLFSAAVPWICGAAVFCGGLCGGGWPTPGSWAGAAQKVQPNGFMRWTRSLPVSAMKRLPAASENCGKTSNASGSLNRPGSAPGPPTHRNSLPFGSYW